MALLDSVMQKTGETRIDPLQASVELLNNKKLRWWQIPKAFRQLIKILFINVQKVSILETQFHLQTEAVQALMNVINLQQKQINLLNERKQNE